MASFCTDWYAWRRISDSGATRSVVALRSKLMNHGDGASSSDPRRRFFFLEAVSKCEYKTVGGKQ